MQGENRPTVQVINGRGKIAKSYMAEIRVRKKYVP
jgi:hypothetical protein